MSADHSRAVIIALAMFAINGWLYALVCVLAHRRTLRQRDHQ